MGQLNKHIYAAHPGSTTLPFLTSDCAKGRRHFVFMLWRTSQQFPSELLSTAQQAPKTQTTGSQAGNYKVLNEHCGKEHEGNSLPCSKVFRILSGHSFNVLCTLFPVCHSPCLWKILQKIFGTHLVNFSLLLQVPFLMH